MASSSIGKPLCRAIGAELRENTTITGASGLEHQVQAIAVDDKGKRVIAVVPEPNARIARLMQSDIQATVGSGVNVIVARPHIVDIASHFRLRPCRHAMRAEGRACRPGRLPSLARGVRGGGPMPCKRRLFTPLPTFAGQARECRPPPQGRRCRCSDGSARPTTSLFHSAL